MCRLREGRANTARGAAHFLRETVSEAIPEADWTSIPYWMDGAADVAETTYTPFQGEPGAAPVRLNGFITDRDGEMLELEADHRRHAEIENARAVSPPTPPSDWWTRG